MTNSKKNALKEQREWRDLQTEKKAYLKRKQDEEEAKGYLKEFRSRLEEEDDPADSL